MTVTLYKQDLKGNIRYLQAFTGTEGQLVQMSGIVGTENPIVHEKTCKAKNVGRSNETSPAEQAEKELESLVAEKLSEGYFKTVLEAQTIKVILPMLAKDFKKEVKKVKYPCFAQPKLDGMRALGDTSLISREGKIIQNLDHIVNVIKTIPHHLDGELYAHGYSFQENMKMIKKYTEGFTEKVSYHVYDLVSTDSFADRYKALAKAVKGHPNIKLVPTVVINSEKELQEAHIKFLSEGYEGTIVRHGEAGYLVNGRSSNLLKYKDFIDIACKIVDITPADQRTEWGVPVLELPDGRTFRAGMKYSHEDRVDFLKNKDMYIGQIGEIRFFEYTDTGIPRFPVMVGIRLDRSSGE